MPKNSQILIDIGQGMAMMVGLPTIDSWDSHSRPQKARAGTFGFNNQTNSLEYWDGQNWYTALMSEE